MTDLVERHKPREGGKSRQARLRKSGAPDTTARREHEERPQRADQIDRALVDQH